MSKRDELLDVLRDSLKELTDLNAEKDQLITDLVLIICYLEMKLGIYKNGSSPV
jgi:hypothetical protein